MLEDVRKMTLEGQEESVSSQCALFVCNKWDQVPEKEIKEVKNHVIKKLKKCWPGINPESQIIHMSTKNASVAQNHGIITEEFFALMNGIRSMVLKSIGARLEMHWKWLDNLLSRIIYQAKAFVMNASRDNEKVAHKMTLIVFRLDLIEKQQTQVMEELHNYLKARVDGAVQKLSEYLKSDGVRARFTSWTLDEVPKAESSWEVTKSNIAKVLESRLREIIEHWEEDNQVFSDARESLLQHFQQRYNFVEGQLRKLQGAVTNDDLDVPESSPPDESLSTTEKVIIGVTSPIWVPLTLVALVVGAPVVGILAIKSKLEDKSRIKKYEKDKCAFMAETSADFLDDATNEKVLKLFVKDQLKEAKLCLKQIEARIPELIQADKMLCKQLGDETRSQEEIQNLYQPIMDEASYIRGHLAVFGLKEIRSIDIRSEELDWKEDMSPRLGCGAFATVYQGKMTKHGVEQIVALKVCNEILDAKNACLIMAEVDLLRKLDHPHIVKFYGTSLLKKSGTTRVILVMEKCEGNLKNHIFDHPESVPASSRNPAMVREACRWAKEITGALAFMHKQGVVHRDLKLENVLRIRDFPIHFSIYTSCRIHHVCRVGRPKGSQKHIKKTTFELGKPVRISSSEEENSSHVLKDDAILVDIQRKLEKLNMLDKIDERLIKMEDDMGTIKQKVLDLEKGLNAVNSDVEKLKEDVESKADKARLQILENEVEELRNRSRRNNLVFYNIPEKAEGQNCVEFIQNFIANHMGLESICGYVEIERAHRTPTNPASRYNKKQPRPIHVALLRYTDKMKVLSNAASRLKDNRYDGNVIGISADFAKKTQEQRKVLLPFKKHLQKKFGDDRKVFIAYPATLKYIDEDGTLKTVKDDDFEKLKGEMVKYV
ncbi:hypothetical protein ACROYT_G027278 [Oculina patagonica]